MVAGGRGLAEPRLSPEGDRLAFVSTIGGRGALVVVPSGGGAELTVTAAPAPSSAHPFGGGVFDWAPDGGSIVYAARGGALHVVPATGGPARALEGAASGEAPSVSPDGTQVAYVAETDRSHVAVASLVAGGPWPVRLSTGADFCVDPTWSPDGRWVAWHEWDVPAMPWDSSRIVAHRADGTGELRVVAGGEGVSVSQPRFGPDGSLAFLSDAEGWRNLWIAPPSLEDVRPLVAEHHEHGGPTWGPGARTFCWSPDGGSVAFCRNEGGFGRFCVVDRASGEVRELAKGVFAGLSWQGGRVAGLRSGARTPNQLATVDPVHGARTELVRGPVGGFEPALVEPEQVVWAGDDGADVHGRLYRAAGASASRPGAVAPPLIVWVHGGPTDQWQVVFNPRIAFFLDRGWAVLTPDHRGSTGWGRAYTQAMAGRWGELDVADVIAGVRAAVDRGWGDARRIVMMGGSAGGFTVLGALAGHPELFAAGVDLYGVADLLELNETTHRYERHYLHSIVGPLPGTVERYRERSPVNLADRIRAPLLVLQGGADEVVPPAQSQALVDRVRQAGGTVEHHLYEGEGHGWSRPETVEDELTRIEAFLDRHVQRWRETSA